MELVLEAHPAGVPSHVHSENALGWSLQQPRGEGEDGLPRPLDQAERLISDELCVVNKKQVISNGWLFKSHRAPGDHDELQRWKCQPELIFSRF